MKIDWVRKLASRKFWVCICGLVTGLIIYFGGTEENANAIEGIIMSVASIVTYIFAEAIADAYNGNGEDSPNDESH